MPKVTWALHRARREGRSRPRALADGKRHAAASPRWRCRPCASCPTRASAATAGSKVIGWTLPIDDTHFRIYTAGRVREKGVFLPKRRRRRTGKRWRS